MIEKMQTEIPKDVLIRFEKRMNTLASMDVDDPHRVRTTASYANEFNSYPGLKMQILTSTSDKIRGAYAATATAHGVVRK